MQIEETPSHVLFDSPEQEALYCGDHLRQPLDTPVRECESCGYLGELEDGERCCENPEHSDE